MSSGTEAATGRLAAQAGGGGPPAGPLAGPGRLLGRLSVLPSLLVMAWLLAGLPLLLEGRFTPVLMLVVSVLTFGGLAARLAGPRWAPLAALLLGGFTARAVHQPVELQ